MRHVPLTLYIDTEFFKRNALRFDTSAFRFIKEKFRAKSLRLLVPQMMERELLRHFDRLAKDCGGHIGKALGIHQFRATISAKALSKENVEAEIYSELLNQWKMFKDHFTVQELPLTGSLDTVVGWYFSISAPFSEKKPREFPDAFILSAIDEYQGRNPSRIAIIGDDSDFIRSCEARRFLFRYSGLEDYGNALLKEESPTQIPEPDVQNTITLNATEDLQETRAIIALGSRATELEISRLIKILLQFGESYRYFFSTASDPFWLSYISAAGVLGKIPEVEILADGNQRHPFWPPGQYLSAICDLAPDLVFETLRKLPPTRNLHALEAIVSVVIRINRAESLSVFNDAFLAFVQGVRWGTDTLIKLLSWPLLLENLGSANGLTLFKTMIDFVPGTDERNRSSPRYGRWQYGQILEKGVRVAAQTKPYEIARILLDSTAGMLRLNVVGEIGDNQGQNDYSEIWCPRIGLDGEFDDAKVTLVKALAYACELVYVQVPEYTSALDSAMRNYSWLLFQRLRQFLYSKFPSERTKPWIRELILAYGDYNKKEYHYEFQLMIRKACETFGLSLLPDFERASIFEAILSGPSRESFEEWMGDRFTEAGFRQRQDYFQRKQLQPFATVLLGKYKERYEALVAEAMAPLADDDYAPVRGGKSGFVAYQSPKSIEELSLFSDNDLLLFINSWQEEHRDPKDWLLEINISALASAFEAVIRQKVLPDPSRLAFWQANWKRITRPIYLRFFIKALQEEVAAGNFAYLTLSFDLCRWVLTHLDEPETDESATNPREDSDEHPAWNPVRSAVIDFVGICVSSDAKTPLVARADLASILTIVCTQPDDRLDHDKPIILNQRDPLTEAINNTRSRAIEDVIDFGFWVRRHNQTDKVSEVGAILDARLQACTILPLTAPEYALLGTHFNRLTLLDESWAIAHKAVLFPQTNPELWAVAFGTYLRYSNPYTRPFNILNDDYVFALDQFDPAGIGENGRRDWGDKLGEHLFTYYIWNLYPLTGNESLLDRYYQKTIGHKERWAHLFDHIGRTLRNTQETLDPDIRGRIFAFVDWRMSQKNETELSEFKFWLNAKCVDADWRLATFSKILDIAKSDGVGTSMTVDTLCELLPGHHIKVIECFTKLLRGLEKNDFDYIQTDKAKPILCVGLASHDENTRRLAEESRELLLRAGRFEFLDN